MKKVFHNQLYDWAVPKNLTEPVYVMAFHVALSEVEQEVEFLLKVFRPFLGNYSLHVEFTEPNEDPQFVLKHIGAVISVYAETIDLQQKMREVLHRE